MPVESKFYAALSASTSLAALVSTRIYPIHAVQSGSTPSVTFLRVSGARVNDLQGYSHLENSRYQVDIHTTGVDQLRTIGDQVISALTGATAFRALADSPIDDYDDDLRLYRRILEFSIWNKE